MQASRSTARTCRSLPPSIGAPSGTGYGPRVALVAVLPEVRAHARLGARAPSCTGCRTRRPRRSRRAGSRRRRPGWRADVPARVGIGAAAPRCRGSTGCRRGNTGHVPSEPFWSAPRRGASSSWWSWWCRRLGHAATSEPDGQARPRRPRRAAAVPAHGGARHRGVILKRDGARDCLQRSTGRCTRARLDPQPGERLDLGSRSTLRDHPRGRRRGRLGVSPSTAG